MFGTLPGPTRRSDEDVRNAIFVVRAGDQMGTGALVGSNRHILTAAHVVSVAHAEPDRITVYNALLGEQREAVSVLVDNELDLALLELAVPITISEVRPFHLAATVPRAGLNVSMYGFPSAFGSGWFYATLGNEEADHKLTINFAITFDPAVYGGVLSGLSGGPVFDMNDRSVVVAVVTQHGPVNYQMGRVAPTARFYNRITELLGEDVYDQMGSSTASEPDWNEAPDVGAFFGRASELALLDEWVLQERCRLVAITGLAGEGKTALAARYARSVINEFEFILWRRLLNAPSLTELARSLAGAISDQQDLVTRISDDEITRLLDFLRLHRCLLVFDNVELVFEADDKAIRYREGYEDYGRFLEAVATSSHQSCVIITSRVEPPEVTTRQSESGTVRAIALRGVTSVDAQQIVSQIGQFAGRRADWAALNDYYEGNPLALQLAAHHIKDVYQGSLQNFLQAGEHFSRVFAGLQDLLDWHLERLSDAQREVVNWLAVNREPMALSELAHDLLMPGAKARLPSTIYLLQRSIPLDSSLRGFSLQPVLIEHVTEKIVARIVAGIQASDFRSLSEHAVIKALAKDHIRESQVRLIVSPIIASLIAASSTSSVSEMLSQTLAEMREHAPHDQTYAAGVLMNLIIQSDVPAASLDFSGLTIRQAYLQARRVQQVSFCGSTFIDCAFTDTFGPVLSLSFNHDSTLLAAGTVQGEVRVWRVPNGEPYAVLRGHVDWAWVVAFSRDGEFLFSAGSDRTVRKWDVKTGQCTTIMRGHTDEIRSISIAEDGHLLATGAQDQTVRLWDTRTGECRRVLQGHNTQGRSVALNSLGTVVASADDHHAIRLFDTGSGEVIRTLTGHSGLIRSLVFEPAGYRLVSGGEDGQIRLWNSDDGNCINEWQDIAGHVYQVAFTTDGRAIASMNEAQQIRLRPLDPGATPTTLDGSSGLLNPVSTTYESALAFGPNSDLMATGSDDQNVRLWDVRTGESIRTIHGYANPAYAAAVNASGKVVCVGAEDQVVHLFDLEAKSYTGQLTGHEGPVWSVAASRENLIASGSSDRTARVWDVQSKRCLKILRGHGSRVRGVTFSPADSLLATCSEDETVRLWRIGTGECLGILRGHSDAIWAVAFNPSGTLVASGSEDGTIRLWDITAMAQVGPPWRRDGRIYTISFSPDGLTLASAGTDRVITVADVVSGQVTRRFEGHTDRIRSICFSPSGSLMVSGGVDGTIRIWDVTEGRCLRTSEEEDIIWSVALGPDGNTIVSTSDNGLVAVRKVDDSYGVTEMRSPRPYEGTNITSAIGLTEAQRACLRALGAIDE